MRMWRFIERRRLYIASKRGFVAYIDELEDLNASNCCACVCGSETGLHPMKELVRGSWRRWEIRINHHNGICSKKLVRGANSWRLSSVYIVSTCAPVPKIGVYTRFLHLLSINRKCITKRDSQILLRSGFEARRRKSNCGASERKSQNGVGEHYDLYLNLSKFQTFNNNKKHTEKIKRYFTTQTKTNGKQQRRARSI